MCTYVFLNAADWICLLSSQLVLRDGRGCHFPRVIEEVISTEA